MKIGITGASGNLESELSSKISQSNSNQVLPISISEFDINRSPKKYFDDVDLIIHCATCYGRNVEEISDVMLGNLGVPLKILEKIKTNKVFINIDTILKDGVSGYSFSKGCFLKTAKFLVGQGYEGKIINVKLHSFYGVKSNSRDLIYNLTKQLLENNDVIELTQCE